MSLRSLARHGGILAVSALLATLAAAAPMINADGGPPRSVFLRLPANAADPTVAMELKPRDNGTWRLTIHTTGFTFTSICVTDAEAVPVGHAHVIVNGAKVASAFEPFMDIGPLPPGQHDVTVVLRGRDHRALLGKNGLIKADTTITVER